MLNVYIHTKDKQNTAIMWIYECVWEYLPWLLVTVTLCVLLYNNMFVRDHGLPPGPGWNLPVIGHLLMVKPDMRNMLRSFRRKYGDVYSFYLGNKLTIVIAGYEANKEAFLKNGEDFAERPTDMFMLDEITKKMGIVNVSGELWKTTRRFALMTLKNFGMGKSILEKKVQSEIVLLNSAFAEKVGQSFDPSLMIHTGVSNIISSLAFGGHFKHGDARFTKILQALDENFQTVVLVGMVQFIPVLRKLPGDLFMFSKLFKNADFIYESIDEIVREHVVNFDENNIEDFTSAYIQEMRSRDEDDLFNLKQLTITIGDLFAAGMETTSTTLRWVLLYLMNYPDLQQRMFEQIVEHIGTHRLPSMVDKINLTYTESFTMEVLRHAQNGFVSHGHATPRNVSFRGYTIPPDALILPDLDSIMHDKDIWGDPETFRPDRFLDGEGRLHRPDEFIPFFLGKRSCIGEALAKMELLLFTGAIVQKFKLSAPPGDDVSLDNIDGVFGMFHNAKPYRILLTLR